MPRTHNPGKTDQGPQGGFGGGSGDPTKLGGGNTFDPDNPTGGDWYNDPDDWVAPDNSYRNGGGGSSTPTPTPTPFETVLDHFKKMFDDTVQHMFDPVLGNHHPGGQDDDELRSSGAPLRRSETLLRHHSKNEVRRHLR